MNFLIFFGILSSVNCEWGNCTICDYEKPTIEDGCTRKLLHIGYVRVDRTSNSRCALFDCSGCFQPWKVLEFEVQGNKVETWIDIDDDVWTGFLSQQPGYVSKGAYYPQDCDRTKTDYCLVTWVSSPLLYY